MIEEQKIKVLVFDDAPERENRYRLLENNLVNIDFIGLKNEDTDNIIKNIDVGIAPDIIFIDHRLDNSSHESIRLMPTGKNVTPCLRDKWANVPIFGVTAAKKDCIEQGGAIFYEDIFDFNDISQLEDFIPSVVNGYRKFRSSIPMVTGDPERLSMFTDLLIAPEDEVIGILHSIPDELRSLETDNFSHAIYRWFRRMLYGHAGFLYDKDWAAVTMGINIDHFNLYLDAFDSARYSGIWGDLNDPRWWKKKLYDLAIEERTSPRESIQAAACKRFKISEQHYSYCSKCGEPWPEVLAFTDEAILAELVPAHLECSIPHPRRFVSLAFEEPRILI
nr:hypothetical protein [uncultured Desulfuromonas sp.]